MKFNLKKVLKNFKLNESTISMVLGAVVIVVVGVLVANYFKDRSGQITSGEGAKTELSGTKTYTVNKGDSLWDIAEKETGSGFNWVKISEANNLENPGVLYEGQKLTIPSFEIKEVAQTPTEGSISGATYEVQKGDSLWDIAVRAYGDGYRWNEIARENNLSNPNTIHSGNILVLPR